MADEVVQSCSSSKTNEFQRTAEGKYKCLICTRSLASKQNILLHLHKVHNLTPTRRSRKLYQDDDTVSVPVRTLSRWKKNNTRKSLQPVFQATEHSAMDASDAGCSSDCLDKDSSTCISRGNSPSPSSQQSPIKKMHSPPHTKNLDLENKNMSVDLSDDSEDGESLSSKDENEDDESLSSEDENEDDESLSSEDENEDDESLSSEDEHVDVCSADEDVKLPELESQALSILSCFLRNNLSSSACKDILDTMKQLFPNTKAVLDFGQMLSYVDKCPIKEVHYCILCNTIFSDVDDEYRCSMENCEGLRYKGPESRQLQKGRQPRQCFVMADTKQQLISLLQTAGIWQDIEKCKAFSYKNKGSDIITDITDGKAYQELLSDQGFLSKNSNNLTAIFNTDGVSLYSSSKIQLWPLFLAINELSPKLRFARDNMLLVGIWQGKGKPPFRQYLTVFSEYMNNLYNNGVDVKLHDESFVNVKLAVVCGIADLPAKAEMLCMTYFNGSEACIACEDPGMVVKQGKGNARCYPYRSNESKYEYRNHQEVISHMQAGRDKKHCKGFKGKSGLASLQSYDIVKGTVPDYMHGVLLGITKTLLNKWFSPTESKNKYFIGKDLKAISSRMKNIKPPSSIERLPRDLEKHYNHFKATELQAWLLYYAIPCLDGFLEEEYMSHLACLSEAIYILLGDKITPSSLERAETLLDTFYSSFQNLYGDGSCGLNVHNVRVHLVSYVKLWGPLWAWNCFPFEDANSVLLQSVHGTGIVLKQAMRYRQAQACIRRKGLNQGKMYSWKVTHEAKNCAVCGAKQIFKQNELNNEILKKLEVINLQEVKKVDRITVNCAKFYSSDYSRMQKRICSFVLYDSSKIGSIRYFVLHESENKVYAVIHRFEKELNTSLSRLTAGKHLFSIKTSPIVDVVAAEKLVDTLVFIQIDSKPNQPAETYVVKMPNHHGHSIFK